MEYDRQIEMVTIWGSAVREWLLLDAGSRQHLLVRHGDIFAPLNESAFSSATRYSDFLSVTESLNNDSQDTREATSHLEANAPNLLGALKNLAAMDDHGSKGE